MGKKLSAINALTLSKLNSYIFKFMRFYLGKKFPQVHDEIQVTRLTQERRKIKVREGERRANRKSQHTVSD